MNRSPRIRTARRCDGRARCLGRRLSLSNPPVVLRVFSPFTWTMTLGALACALFLGSGAPALGADSHKGYSRARYVLPKDIAKTGMRFASERVPLNRKDVAQRVMDQINFLLMDRRATIMEWFDRMAEYGPMMTKVLVEEKVPRDMLYLAALLSDMMPNARTRTGGVGWWALGAGEKSGSRSVASWLSTNDWDDRRDPVISTRIASNIFNWLHGREITKSWDLTICAYLDGTDAIDAAAKKTHGYSYWDTVLPPRAEIIVPRLVALKIISENRKLYGVDIKTAAPLAFDSFNRVKLKKDLPLHVVAQWCKVAPRIMWSLNPGVSPVTGILPKTDKRNRAGFPLRVPKGMGRKVHRLLIKDGYLDR